MLPPTTLSFPLQQASGLHLLVVRGYSLEWHHRPSGLLFACKPFALRSGMTVRQYLEISCILPPRKIWCYFKLSRRNLSTVRSTSADQWYEIKKLSRTAKFPSLEWLGNRHFLRCEKVLSISVSVCRQASTNHANADGTAPESAGSARCLRTADRLLHRWRPRSCL
ncbi:hypothetical protein D3C85_1066330 [compost metagenome]